MEHKHKVLLQGLASRNFFTTLNYGRFTHQINALVHVDINNFFLVSTHKGISEVLAKASSPNASDGPYFSDEFAWYSMSLVSTKNILGFWLSRNPVMRQLKAGKLNRN